MADEVIARLVGRLAFEVEPQGVEQFNKGLKEAEEGSKSAGVAGIAFGNILADVAGAAANAALSIVNFAAATAKDLVFGFVESGAEIDRWSKTIKIGVEDLQELQFAAKMVAGEEGVDAMNEGLVTLRENLGELRRVGTGPAKDSLGSLGIELADIENLGAAEQLDLLATALSEVGAQEQISISKELLGDDGGRLLTLLQQGGEGIQKMRDRAQELGVVMDEEAIAKAKETAVAMAEMDSVIEGAGNQIAIALAPQLTEAAGRLTQWIGENDKLIQQDIPAFIEDVVEVGGALLTWAIETGEEFQFLGQQIVFAAESLEETLVSAYETAEPVISFVSDVIDEQVEALGEVVAFIERMVGRLEAARSIVASIETGLGLDETVTHETRGARPLASGGQGGGRLPENLSSSDIQQALASPGLNDVTRKRLLDQLPKSSKREREASEAEVRRVTKEAREALQIAQDNEEKESDRAERKRLSDEFREGELDKDKKKGRGGVNTREARALLGPEIERLASAAGLGRRAIKAALEAAAKELSGGGSGAATRARAAASKKIESLGGGAPKGVDAALFGMLSKTIGAKDARSATAGARLVNIDSRVMTTVTMTVEVPPEFAQATTVQGQAAGIEAALAVALGKRDAMIVQRFAPGPARP